MARKKVVLLLIFLIAIGLGFNSLLPGTHLQREGGITPAARLPTGAPASIQQASAPSSSIAAVPRIELRMQIFTARIGLEVQDIRKAVSEVASLAKSFDGFVASSSISGPEMSESATVVIRVPKEHLEAAVQALGALGKPRDLSTSSDDVTEEYIDLRARRENLIKQEQRLLDILKAAKQVSEILQVERELERVRGEIERLTGRINFLDRNVAMSLITVFISRAARDRDTSFPVLDLSEPVRAGIAFLFAVVRGLVLAFFIFIPLASIGIPSYLAFRRLRVRRKPA